MIPSELIGSLRNDYSEITRPILASPIADNELAKSTIFHTEMVMGNCQAIALAMDLNLNEQAIIEIIARFHDIGRLLMLVNPPADSSPTDHAQVSVQFLEQNGSFQQLEPATRNIILQVIEHHNKPVYKSDNETMMFYFNLLRDGDKMDNWRMTYDFLTRKGSRPTLGNEWVKSNKPTINPALLKKIVEGGRPLLSEVETFNDFVAVQMSWVFDLHFKKSFQMLNQRQYIRHMYESLPKKDDVIEIYRMIRIHIENSIKLEY